MSTPNPDNNNPGSLKIKFNVAGPATVTVAGKRKADDVQVIQQPTDQSSTGNLPIKKEKKEKKHKKEKKEKKSKKEKLKIQIPSSVITGTPTQSENTSWNHAASGSDSEASASLPKMATRSLMATISKKKDIPLSSSNTSDWKDYTFLDLKPDATTRPLWIAPDGHIFLETFSPIYKQAYDFLVAIAEPESRSFLFHEYQLTPYSLYASVSVGLETEDIITVLNRLSKVKIPDVIEKFIRDCTLSYGKVSLVLQRNRFFVESQYPEVLQTLLKDKIMQEARIKAATDMVSDPITGLIISKLSIGNVQISGGLVSNQSSIDPMLMNDGATEDGADKTSRIQVDDDEEDRVDSASHQVHSFEIDASNVENVKKRCIELDFPMMEEYDFRNDTHVPGLAIDLKPTTRVRPYQEKSLSKMFGNGRARSGIIVLPCGAGKTLVGITATATVKKAALVLCNSGVSVEQWRYQFKLWSTIEDKHIARFTSDQKEQFHANINTGMLVITTYTMLAFGGKRSKESLKIMEELQSREWGLVLLDEVHVVPAHVFRRVLTVTRAHCKLGLTATLVREDDKISDLNFLIGPKLYEANWIDLQRSGHIAKVQCIEVWCQMQAEFFREYLKAPSLARKTLLYVMNPVKFRYCQFLIKYHEARGDKIIVFSDNIYALENYAIALGKPYMYGPTSGKERENILKNFQFNPKVNTIFISKVGDTSIDLPEATVIIQISSHYGSRRQEAQRLGRILRPKAKSEGEFNAFFYSLVSRDTEEIYYSTKRQQFLIDQGYSFKVVSHLPVDGEDLLFSTKKDQLELLAKVLALDESQGNEEELPEDYDDLTKQLPSAKRTTGSGRSLAGGHGTVYSEASKKSGGAFGSNPQKHSLFKDRNKKK